MYPFNINPFFPGFGPFGPFGPFGFPCGVRRRRSLPTVDRRGIPEVCTTGVIENSEVATPTVDFGINPCVWRELPNQTVILWKVRHPVSQAASGYAATIVVPNSSSTTVATPNTTTAGTTKVPVVDNKSTQVTGGDVTVPTGTGTESQQGYTTEHMVYIDKCQGIFRLLGVKAASAPVPNNTPSGGGSGEATQASAVSAKK